MKVLFEYILLAGVFRCTVYAQEETHKTRAQLLKDSDQSRAFAARSLVSPGAP